MSPRRRFVPTVLAVLAAAALLGAAPPAAVDSQAALDARVRAFLEKHADDWHDMNVPEVDGKTLHDLVVKHGYQRGLEIGTSTGHSTIWIAWAMSRTGGKLITIEIDPSRHAQALENFEEAGLSSYIDARLADAHQLVTELEGPFDFVFNDADKEWYRNYFVALSPKLEVGGCYTAHNARLGQHGVDDFIDYVKSRPNYETTIDRKSRSGLSISFKRAAD